MSNKGKKLQPQFGLDMPFDEAMARFIRADPVEVDALIKRGKKRKPPGTKQKRKAPGGTSQSANVVDLRRRRMRKRSTGK